jgi:RHS repeat-associated protein
VDAGGGTVSYTYDAAGNRLTVSDPNAHTTSFTYDTLSRVATKTEPLGGAWTYSYDLAGNKTSQTDPKGQTVQYQYDALNRLKTVTFPGGTVTFTYDANGNRTQMVDAAGTTTYAYDELNRLVSVTDPFGKVLQYDYDAGGNRTRLTYPDGKVVLYTYDVLNRLATVKDWLNQTTSYSYDDAGRLVHVTNGNGTVVDYGYDVAGRMTGLANKKGDGTVLSSYAYTLDPLGNQAASVQTEPLAQPDFVDGTVSYTADAENRLTSAGGETVAHDANGNVMTQGTDTFTWDANDRLVASTIGGMAGSYAYNGVGHRLRRTLGGVVTRYVVDPSVKLSTVVAETDGTGAITAYYVHGLGLIERIDSGGQARFYHYDYRGSTIALTDAIQAATASYAYSSFGAVVASSGTTANPFRYLGSHGIVDEGNGLLAVRARYYRPATGRFLSKDLIVAADGKTQTMHRYAYADNSPTNLMDLSGLTPTSAVDLWDVANWVWKPVRSAASFFLSFASVGREIETDRERNGGKSNRQAAYDRMVEMSGDLSASDDDFQESVEGVYEDAGEEVVDKGGRLVKAGFDFALGSGGLSSDPAKEVREAIIKSQTLRLGDLRITGGTALQIWKNWKFANKLQDFIYNGLTPEQRALLLANQLTALGLPTKAENPELWEVLGLNRLRLEKGK